MRLNGAVLFTEALLEDVPTLESSMKLEVEEREAKVLAAQEEAQEEEVSGAQ